MIREINRSEIPECVVLIRESFLTVANEFNFTQTNAPGFTAFSTSNERLYWQYDNENRKMFAFLYEGKIIGYYSLLFGENKECELDNLCVNPVYRHRKIGEQLLNHCFTFAKGLGISKIKIGIVEENTQLRKWYEAHGFIHIKTEKYAFFPFTCGYMEQNIQQSTK